MIASEIGGFAASCNAEFLGEANAFMAACTRGWSYVLRRYRGIRIVVRLDGVDAVTICAHRGLPVALRAGLSVDALLKFFRNTFVALAAG